MAASACCRLCLRATRPETLSRAAAPCRRAGFLAFFEATAPLLRADPTLWCVSSWNDNGFAPIAKDNTRLFRTNYFPGLGWMLRKQLWVSGTAREM